MAQSANPNAQQNQPGSWACETQAFLRDISSSFLFGVALLYTMEVWWVGMVAELWKLLLFLLFTIGINIFIGYFSGISERNLFHHVVFEAIEAFAIGCVATTLCMFTLNRISLSDPMDIILGKIMVMVVPFSIGAFVANRFIPFIGGRKPEGKAGEEEAHPWKATLEDIGATLIGGIFIGFPIASTEEVPMLASELGHLNELALIALSLAVSYVIVFASSQNEANEANSKKAVPFLQRPLMETLLCYAVSLILAFVLLFFFNQIQPDDPLTIIVSEVLVLGFPIAIGGAAGRLAA